MQIYLIAAISADGFIARHDNELADWTSKEDKKLFVELTKKAGVIVMGGKTFRTIGKALPGRRNIVYSRESEAVEGIEFTDEAPKALVARLAREGCKQIAICGGGTVYDMFLSSGLVSDVYLSVEPIFFGKGVNLVNSLQNIEMELAEHKMLNQNTILLHYKIR